MKQSGLRKTHSLPDSIQQRLNIAPKSLGICPDCGTEQTGTVYRISNVLAEFLKPKYENVFVPDKHHCGKKSATG